MKSMRFNGFSSETFDFLVDLRNNNDRDWFQDQRERYENFFLGSSLQFIDAIGPGLKKISPHFTAIAKKSGGSLMRIYRDIRFSKNKAPYKTNIGIQFRHEFGKDVHAPGFYLHLDPDECFFGAGIWRPDNQTLKKIRLQIVEQDRRWKSILRKKELKNDFQLAGESLKRSPRDFDESHPLIEDLKRKDFIVIRSVSRKEIVGPSCVKTVLSYIKTTMPFMRYLCDALKLPA